MGVDGGALPALRYYGASFPSQWPPPRDLKQDRDPGAQGFKHIRHTTFEERQDFRHRITKHFISEARRMRWFKEGVKNELTRIPVPQEILTRQEVMPLIFQMKMIRLILQILLFPILFIFGAVRLAIALHRKIGFFPILFIFGAAMLFTGMWAVLSKDRTTWFDRFFSTKPGRFLRWVYRLKS